MELIRNLKVPIPDAVIDNFPAFDIIRFGVEYGQTGKLTHDPRFPIYEGTVKVYLATEPDKKRRSSKLEVGSITFESTQTIAYAAKAREISKDEDRLVSILEGYMGVIDPQCELPF
ncbi:hypothetical protein ACFLZX_00880 [Nanoarchaeota archaeon]